MFTSSESGESISYKYVLIETLPSMLEDNCKYIS